MIVLAGQQGGGGRPRRRPAGSSRGRCGRRHRLRIVFGPLYTAGFTLYMVTIIEIYSVKPPPPGGGSASASNSFSAGVRAASRTRSASQDPRSSASFRCDRALAP
jgi:hypothetical protein